VHEQTAGACMVPRVKIRYIASQCRGSTLLQEVIPRFKLSEHWICTWLALSEPEKGGEVCTTIVGVIE